MSNDRPDEWIQTQIQMILHAAEHNDVEPMVLFAGLMGGAKEVKSEINMDQYEDVVEEIEQSMLDGRDADLSDDDDDDDGSSSFRIGGPLE